MSVGAKANILHRNPENDFELIQKIGSGTYGEVYKVKEGKIPSVLLSAFLLKATLELSY